MAIDAGPTYAVLAIFGASGTGKTHLARGLVRSWQERGSANGKMPNVPNTSPRPISATQLADAIRREAVDDFRRRSSRPPFAGHRRRRPSARQRLPPTRAPLHDRRLRRIRRVAGRDLLDVRVSVAGNLVARCPQPARRRARIATRPARASGPRAAGPPCVGRPWPAAFRRSGPPLGCRRHRHCRRCFRGAVRTAEDGSNLEGGDLQAVERFSAERAASQPPMREHPRKPLRSTTACRKKCSKRLPPPVGRLGPRDGGLPGPRTGRFQLRTHRPAPSAAATTRTIMHNYRKIAELVITRLRHPRRRGELQRQLPHQNTESWKTRVTECRLFHPVDLSTITASIQRPTPQHPLRNTGTTLAQQPTQQAVHDRAPTETSYAASKHLCPATQRRCDTLPLKHIADYRVKTTY